MAERVTGRLVVLVLLLLFLGAEGFAPVSVGPALATGRSSCRLSNRQSSRSGASAVARDPRRSLRSHAMTRFTEIQAMSSSRTATEERRHELPQKKQKPSRTVIKFGGSSLATAKRVREVTALVKLLIDDGQMPTMVCSAMGKTTDNLINAGTFALNDGKVYIDAIRTLHMSACEELGLGEHTKKDVESLLDDLRGMLEGVGMLRELTDRSRDKLVSYGERMAVRVTAAALNKFGVPAQHFDAWTLGMRTTGEFGRAEVLDESYNLIRATLDKFDPNMVAVVTGFLGHSPDQQITTLGRGGSDLTATVIGVACDADEVQVWKDVDGLMTADPRAVAGAIPVPRVSYDEAAELAYFGANILHPVSMRPAMTRDLPVRIKNSYNPSHPGTVITRDRELGDTLVTAITFKKGVALVDIVSTRMVGQYGFLKTVFAVFARHRLSIDMVATSEVSISLTLDQAQDEEDLARCLKTLGEIADVTDNRKRSIISLIANVSRSSEVMAEVFAVMRDAGIQVLMLSQGASKVNVGLVVKEKDTNNTVQALHKHFFAGENRSTSKKKDSIPAVPAAPAVRPS